MYYLPQNAEVCLEEVQVNVYDFDPELVQNDTSESGKLKVLSRLQSPQNLGSDYESLLLPALPCQDLLDSKLSYLGIGYLKAQSGISGIKSGKRSALIPDGDRFLRLKGCGNLTEGFTIEPMVYPEDKKEIRGCCFQNTVIREQFMTWKINQALKSEGYFTGNIPLKYWEYQTSEYSLIKKYCGVFVTLGEKRLGSHLLTGLFKLLHNIEGFYNKNILVKLFPESRKTTDGVLSTVKILKNLGPANMLLDTWTSQGVYKDNTNLFDLSICDLSSFIENKEFIGRYNLIELIRKLVNVVYRIGWEVGIVKRVLQDNYISWGYFIDHNPFEPHCNAHCNNFIILGPQSTNILAPVDFDMAFSKTEFISPIEGEGFGTNDIDLFENWVNCERNCLEYTLAGQENMANFVYGNQSESVLATAFRDLLVLAFRESFDKGQPRLGWQRDSNEDAIELCLRYSQDIIDY
ncbi:hypothetical protein SteCoe_35324 [Stentor coeruleus]|uniref:Uncharacterized protein n=1 Tax=Stentor coeruleus TaxID=5963 RepID=A0A1R2ASX4_9CILI|nr:hypothetical protein SteCoe_35324 [Stentor coeruleus]